MTFDSLSVTNHEVLLLNLGRAGRRIPHGRQGRQPNGGRRCREWRRLDRRRHEEPAAALPGRAGEGPWICRGTVWRCRWPFLSFWQLTSSSRAPGAIEHWDKCRLSGTGETRGRNPERRRALFHLLWPCEKERGEQKILIAGCGTSQAATVALREPHAHITAIDISETSLGYTRDLQQKYALENLELRRLAIEDVQTLGRTFDQVVCTGVLHHLPDSDSGLRALRAVLEPEGAMHLMVYAAYGRAGVYMMQEYCRLLELSASDAELQDLGNTIGALPADHPIARVASRAKDFRRPDALADALLHPQDRAYTVPQLYAWLERCGMSFGRWFEQAPYLAHCGILARTPHSARLASLSARLQHAAVELFRGTMVQHSLIAYRDDRSRECQPIDFDGDGWREYIPLRLPWTVCIRERVPPGSVAVLINRAHTFPDLALPIDAAEERIVAAIDGKRSIGDIMRIVAGNGGEEEVPKFFERLWRHDQVVFDASRVFEAAASPLPGSA